MIEIKEVIVRANINPTPLNKKNGVSDGKKEEDCAQTNTSEGSNESIIESCVKQVLAILERQKQR
jgi:Family of unknown function (DUF5908)